MQNPEIAALDTSATGFTVSISTEQLDLIDADLVVAFPIFIDSSELTERPVLPPRARRRRRPLAW